LHVRKFPLILVLICVIAALIFILPLVVPSEIFTMIPFHENLSELVDTVRSHAIPHFSGGILYTYAIPIILGLWALFFLVTMHAPSFWWMAPYSMVVVYTLYLFTQLRAGQSQPALFLERLSREPTMGSVLIILAMLLELTIALLFLIVSIRLHRRFWKGKKSSSSENRKLEQKEHRAQERKALKQAHKEQVREERDAKKSAKRAKKGSSRKSHTEDSEAEARDESTMVTLQHDADIRETGKSSYTYPDSDSSSIDSEAPLAFPAVREMPRLKTIGNEPKKESELYVGSVKVKDDDSVLLADTPIEDIDEPEEVPVGKTYDPIPSLRKQLEQDALTAPFEVPTSMPKPEPSRQTASQKPASQSSSLPVAETKSQEPSSAHERVVTQTRMVDDFHSADDTDDADDDSEEDMDQISGVGGLVSSNAGSSALLSRNKLRYNFPSDDLLETYPDHVTDIDAETQAAGENLILTLKQFKIDATLMKIVKGPTVTMFEVSPAPGVRVSSIISLSDNIALQLAARQVRIVAPIPGKQAVGIEVPNRDRAIIGFKDLLPTIDAKAYQVPMILGRKITGEPVVIEITQTPHLLIAGATGSGKSVCVNSLISSILYRRSPKEVRLILVDPKIVELRVYNGIPHLLTPVITEPKKTIKALEFCLYEMDRRYKLLNALAVRNIAAYNKKIKELKLARERLPYIVVVIDEFADLMTTVGKELETLLARLAAMARAVGIHLVLATQRPSANVITGIIKSNIPSRIAFMVASQIDSRIIIDETGAEKLLGRGDMLFAPGWDPNSVRIQGAFLSDEEVERVVAYAKTQGEPDYLDEAFFEDDDSTSNNGDDDDETDDSSDDVLMAKALKIVVERQSASASYLQRRLKIGYNRAARLVEQMEDDGYVGPARGSKPRELLKFPD